MGRDNRGRHHRYINLSGAPVANLFLNQWGGVRSEIGRAQIWLTQGKKTAEFELLWLTIGGDVAHLRA